MLFEEPEQMYFILLTNPYQRMKVLNFYSIRTLPPVKIQFVFNLNF